VYVTRNSRQRDGLDGGPPPVGKTFTSPESIFTRTPVNVPGHAQTPKPRFGDLRPEQGQHVLAETQVAPRHGDAIGDGVDAKGPGRKVVDVRPCFFRQIHQPGQARHPYHFDRDRRRRSGADESGTSRKVGHGVGQSSRGSDLLWTAPPLVSHLYSSFWPQKGRITPYSTTCCARLLGLSIRRLRVRAPSPSPLKQADQRESLRLAQTPRIFTSSCRWS